MTIKEFIKPTVWRMILIVLLVVLYDAHKKIPFYTDQTIMIILNLIWIYLGICLVFYFIGKLINKKPKK